MCASAEYRFSQKSNLYIWARKERGLRWNSLLNFAHLSAIAQETNYFKSQNLNYILSQLEGPYKDMFAITSDVRVSTHVPVDKNMKDSKSVSVK